MEMSDAKRLKSLNEEKWKQKKILAGQMLDNSTLGDMLGKNF